ncbi:hypothetical protein [Pseudomonas aeruginosa]|uniref:hypothetical protein n=1 Tax=Pseudomonas aeruginosa TaxID=287 RepID=UPI000F87B577|nr:hypothetical protein [Pseudomonas aeruginosa]RSZ54065.1 hypothetical protein EJU38_05510 [Pseudomonas aeruginosa]WOT60871.1 hypothetical protein R5018_25090 [Pseudomonas aeruginosa]WOT74321.1 hypothetical protein R5026_27865 [Pseudomonas aeruginosa]WOT85442.1 hypothetical protein R5020_18825 [Pseudomonas aeruginosa]WOT98397.1 hypothetical protein R5015_18760 [Pseudomonas aeruginosa]
MQRISSALRKDLAAALAAGNFDITESGIAVPHLSLLVGGEYFGRVNGGEWEKEGDNLIPTEGLAHILNVAFGSKAKAACYLALFAGSSTPAANWTAANFAAVASEITSMTEGYTSATRPAWTTTDTATGSIDNLNAVATVTIATASQLNVNGAALLTNNTKGGTTGVLVSASKYAATRVFQNGDTYDIGYRLNLTV